MLSHSRFRLCEILLLIRFLVYLKLFICIFAVRRFITVCRRRETHADKETAPTGVQRVRRGAVDAVSKNAFTQPFLRLCESIFTYPIFNLSKTFYLHFCGAWVYRQSESRCDCSGSCNSGKETIALIPVIHSIRAIEFIAFLWYTMIK